MLEGAHVRGGPTAYAALFHYKSGKCVSICFPFHSLFLMYSDLFTSVLHFMIFVFGEISLPFIPSVEFFISMTVFFLFLQFLFCFSHLPVILKR